LSQFNFMIDIFTLGPKKGASFIQTT